MDGDDLEQFGWGQLDVPAPGSKPEPAERPTPDPALLVESQDELPNPFATNDKPMDEEARADQEAFAHMTGDGFLQDDPQEADHPSLELAVDPESDEAKRGRTSEPSARVVERPGLTPREPKPKEPPSPYPPAPTTWWASLPYTLAVLGRSPSVREEVRFAAKQQKTACEAHYNAIVHLGRAYKASSDSEGFEEFFERTETAETSLTSSQVLQDQAKRSEKAEQDAVEAQLRGAASRAHGLEIKESRLDGQAQTQAKSLERIQARVRRVEIELRSIREAEEPKSATADDPALLDELKARRAEAATAGAALRKVEDQLGTVRRELATAHGTVQAEQERIAELCREAQRMNQSRADTRAAATRDLEDALAELGLAALDRDFSGAARNALTAGRAARARLQEADALLAASQSRLKSWDRGAVQRGIAIAIGVVAVFGLLVLLVS